MCGIVGYIGFRSAQEVLIKGLQRLEYRGYDSAGIAAFEDGKPRLVKCAGKVSDLVAKLDHNFCNCNVGIGHTRWATHGAPSDTNAHPHVSEDGKFIIIHNGIIENYDSIRTLLENKGFHFQSDTDTEVLVQLISYLYDKNGDDFPSAVRHALSQVVGAYGIVVMCTEVSDMLVVARFGSPLVLGIGDGEIIVASDSSPIIEYTRNIIYIDEGEMACIKKDDFEVRNILENRLVSKNVEHVEYSLDQIEKGGYPHFMLKEIYEQQQSIWAATRGRIDFQTQTVKLGGIQDMLGRMLEAHQIYITACGTSWHSSLIGSYAIEELVGIPVKVEYASEFRYRETPVDHKSVVIAISQSGETADTLAAVRLAKQKGALTLGIVNVVGSSIARETDCGVYIHAGPEIGVASTKAFTSQVVVMNLIALLLAQSRKIKLPDRENILNDFGKIRKKVERILELSESIKTVAEDFYNTTGFLYLGRGFQFPVALEGALKLKEISYIHAEGYPAAEMKHGPIALIDENMPVVFIVTETGFDKIMSNIQQVYARNGRIIIITTTKAPELHKYSDHIIRIPHIHKFLAPLLTTIPLQLLAYHCAVLRGCDVDQPRNLAKSVTVE